MASNNYDPLKVPQENVRLTLANQVANGATAANYVGIETSETLVAKAIANNNQFAQVGATGINPAVQAALDTKLNASEKGAPGGVAGLDANRMLGGAIIFATDLGVVADDSTDNATALQAAIDAVPATGGVVILPAGRIRVGSTLVITRGYIEIRGAGPGTRSKLFEPGAQTGQGSRLVATHANEVFRVYPAQDAGATVRLGGITFRDFGITGTGRAGTHSGIRSELKSGNSGIYGPTDDMLIERVAVIGCLWGAYLVNDDIPKVRDCWFTECGNGLYMQGTLYGLVDGGCYADNSAYGIHINGGVGSRVINNTLVRNITQSLYLQACSQGVAVVGNAFQADTTGGASSTYPYQVRISSSDTVSVIGNTFRNSGSITCTAAIVIDGSSSNIYSAGNTYELTSGVPVSITASGANIFNHNANGAMFPVAVGATGGVEDGGTLSGNVLRVFLDTVASGARGRLQTFNFGTGTAGRLQIQQAGGTFDLGQNGTETRRVKHGAAVLVAGTVTVSDTTITANSRIILTSNADGGTPGWLRVSARSAGASFTITSSSASDTSRVAYTIIEP